MATAQKIVIINTGCSNLASVQHALIRLGYQPIISKQPAEILSADKVFLPGVGTANAVMDNLQQLDFIELIKNYSKPLLGICLGMQILGSHSEEGNVDLLNIIPSAIGKINSHNLPLPHMGWNQVNFIAESPLFTGITNNSYFYFVHSFCMPVCAATIATTNYGVNFSAIVEQDNFYAVQFHPERSGAVGAKLLQNFLEL